MTATAPRTPIGANTWIWASPISDEGLAGLVPTLAGWGFDLVELPVEGTTDWDPARTADLLARHNLGASLCLAVGPDRDLLSADPATVASTQEYLRFCVDAAATIGAKVVAGPMYSPVGKTWSMTEAERSANFDRVAAALRPVADHAAERGVVLGLEPLNRFETSLVNTAAQAVDLVDRVGSPALGVHLDTFHMNIEEKDQAAAIRLAGSRLVHFHACGVDRGTPGEDRLPWPEIAAALREVGYSGAAVIESFTPQNQTIARAAAIWRPLAASQDALARDGLGFLRGVLDG